MIDRQLTALRYPFEQPPRDAEMLAIAPGVFWLRMPMPFSLDHINVWLLEESEQWTVVDTGVATDTIVELWEQVFKSHLKGKPIKRIICTHMHPDHVGLAGWLCQRDKGVLNMSLGEYTYCRTLIGEKGREAPEETIAFYKSAGLNEEELFHYKAQFGWFGKLVKALPPRFKRLKEGDTINIGDYQWQILVGTGHSPEHICLYCPALNLVFSGDQILPTISSNISVWPTEPFANPLKDWLDSCAKLKNVLPEDVLVLPAHGLPFIGVKHRLQALIDEHLSDLEKLVAFCQTPKRVVDAFPVLFNAEIDKTNRIMATGESYAHFHCLLHENRISQRLDTDGVLWFEKP